MKLSSHFIGFAAAIIVVAVESELTTIELVIVVVERAVTVKSAI